MQLSNTWTPEELLSDLSRLENKTVHRFVEAQHQYATMAISENVADQALLEFILDENKPALPVDAADLPTLLGTPFRYKSVPGQTEDDNGSRFRRAGTSDGVFYCAETTITCAYEIAFYRALFFAESPGLAIPDSALSFSSFSTTIHSEKVLDLTNHKSLTRLNHLWENPSDYNSCQALAEHARECGIEVIAYKSVRDPNGGTNYAVLTPAAFRCRTVTQNETWSAIMKPTSVIMMREFPQLTLELTEAELKKDKRLQ